VRALTGYLWLISAIAGTGQTDPAADLIRDGHWKRARRIVEARLKEAPNDAAAHFYLSQIRNAFGDHQSPLALAERAVALDGNVARYHRQIAEVLGVMAQRSNALQQLFLARRFRKEIDAALAIDPRDVQALRDLTEFYLLAPSVLGGDRRKAEATAGRIYAIDAAEGCLAQARAAQDPLPWLEKSVDVQPPSYRARIALAQFYLDRTPPDFNAAEAAARSGVQLTPGRVEAYTLLAEVYAAQARWSELDATLEESARRVPDDLTPYYRAAARIHDPTRADRYLHIYFSQEPEGNAPTRK
jgi:tetratricopeptide (TPR) repeat protein